MEQVAGISCGGFLRQYVQEATGRLDFRCGHLKLRFSSTTSQVQVQVQVLRRDTFSVLLLLLLLLLLFWACK